jgi:hypothetical protein
METGAFAFSNYTHTHTHTHTNSRCKRQRFALRAASYSFCMVQKLQASKTKLFCTAKNQKGTSPLKKIFIY